MDSTSSAASDHPVGGSSTDLPSRLSGALADRYELERELGRGGMATVYLARDLRHARPVALKVLHRELVQALGPERFLREIRIAAQLQHASILPLFDSGTADGLPYYATRYVDGESLRARIARERQLDLRDALRIAREIAAALDHAHARGVIHRDIKPENILLTRDGQALVADFGIARAVDAAGEEKLTETGLAVGTPAYMSPEQAAGDGQTDRRSDIYALGCVLYEMLAGQPPFTGGTAQAILARHAVDPVPNLRTVRSTVPPQVEQAITKALAKVPSDRFATAGELVTALDGAASGVMDARRRPLRWPQWLALTGALAAVVSVATGHGLRRSGSVSPSSPELVAVLPFRTSAASPELAWLREGLADLLSIQLDGEEGLRTAEPRAVLSAWRRLAGASSEEISTDDAVRIAGALGAGLLVDGSVVGEPERLTITASLLSASNHRTTARASEVGSLDSLPVLVNRLAARLLALDAGVEASRITVMTSSLPAIRAFIAGRAAFREGNFGEAAGQFREATALDSTFALAALELVHASVWVGGPWSEEGERGKRLAQAGRDKLGPGDRALLDAWDVDDITIPGWIQGWQAAAKANPGRAEAWYELGDAYHHFGMLAGLNNPQQLAAEAFRRGWAIDSASGVHPLGPGHSPIVAEPLAHMVEIAQMTRDTALVRRLVATRGRADSTSEDAWYLRWHQTLALGDSALGVFWADSESVEPATWLRIGLFASWTGVGTQDLLRATDLGTRHEEAAQPGAISSARAMAVLNGGRPREARSFLHLDDTAPADLAGRVLDALYWGGDTAAGADAARRLARYASSTARSGQKEWFQLQPLCATTAWHAAHGDYGSSMAAIRTLRAASDTGAAADNSALGIQYATLCAALLEATRATALHLPDARARLMDADVAARTYPQWPSLGANLVVARAAEAQGDLPFALRALRRRGGVFGQFPSYLSTFLREEGRLAALTGDTAGAIRAYQHYLDLRPDPEPEVKPEVARVREELVQLVGEPAGH